VASYRRDAADSENERDSRASDRSRSLLGFLVVAEASRARPRIHNRRPIVVFFYAWLQVAPMMQERPDRYQLVSLMMRMMVVLVVEIDS